MFPARFFARSGAAIAAQHLSGEKERKKPDLMALLFNPTLSSRRQAVTPARDGGYPTATPPSVVMGCSTHNAARDKRAVGDQAEKSRQGTCYERKTTNTLKDQRPQPKDVT
jgi:hypothetical protein